MPRRNRSAKNCGTELAKACTRFAADHQQDITVRPSRAPQRARNMPAGICISAIPSMKPKMICPYCVALIPKVSRSTGATMESTCRSSRLMRMERKRNASTHQRNRDGSESTTCRSSGVVAKPVCVFTIPLALAGTQPRLAQYILHHRNAQIGMLLQNGGGISRCDGTVQDTPQNRTLPRPHQVYAHSR